MVHKMDTVSKLQNSKLDLNNYKSQTGARMPPSYSKALHALKITAFIRRFLAIQLYYNYICIISASNLETALFFQNLLYRYLGWV